MLTRSLRGRYTRPAALTAAFGAAGYAVYRYRNSDTTAARPSFTLPVKSRASDGSVVTEMKSIPYLTKEDAERKLTENAWSTTIPRAGSSGKGVWRYETAFLASNNPIEDANAQMVVQPTEKDFWGMKGDKARDLLFFAIMDGHSGFKTSRLLAKTLIPSVALELQSLVPHDDAVPTKKQRSLFRYFISYFGFVSHPTETSALYPFHSDPKYVSTAIETAFANLDSQIVNAPIKAVDALTQGNKDMKASDLDPKSLEYQLTVSALLPALSGSCALLAMLDGSNNDMYVACTGDSRAVAGYWDVDKNGKGKWRVEVLTDDQTGRNPKEHQRMQSEHPPEEASYVIQRGRVFGGLEPTRAFGDSRYKWPKEFQLRLQQLFGEESGLTIRRPPTDLKTPPYVTSRPEITHRKLPFNSETSSSKSCSSSNLRFLVMATDGLWDRLSSAEVVALTGEYLNRVAPNGSPSSSPPPLTISKSDLAQTTAETPTSLGVLGKGTPQDTPSSKEGAWAFVDKNVSTHLIRNALGGADENELHKLLSIPAPLSRRYRDDLTVTVVWWEDRPEATESVGVKAKL
ncbi:hypothetical protein FS837_010003 [Tulasnella sp. UAMH 9824]|nr:hypothetical protein FS837_010003 [Tulasnella sp. UAMH 9824]